MWKRSELKKRAKEVLRRYFWGAVVVCLISGILAGEYGVPSFGGNNYGNVYNTGESNSVLDSARGILDGNSDSGIGSVTSRVGNGLASLMNAGLVSVFVIFGIGIFIFAFLISIIIGYPILVGSKRFFMQSREEKTGVGTVFYVFKSGHMMKVIFVMFMRNLKTFLWSLLFIVPGIIKSYEYRMIPYILSENPEIDMKRAFELSREMMTGQKWKTFVLDISFILWLILGVFTCGLGNIFFVNPYIAATDAELYAVLRGHILNNGYCNTYELPGYRS